MTRLANVHAILRIEADDGTTDEEIKKAIETNVPGTTAKRKPAIVIEDVTDMEIEHVY